MKSHRPIKRLSFKRFDRLFLGHHNCTFGKSPWLYLYKYKIVKVDNTYEFYQNNGSFMELFFEIEKLHDTYLVKFRYFTKLDPNKRVQNAYTDYFEEFKETIDMLSIKKKIDKYMPIEVSYVTEDFYQLLVEFIHFLEEGNE